MIVVAEDGNLSRFNNSNRPPKDIRGRLSARYFHLQKFVYKILFPSIFEYFQIQNRLIIKFRLATIAVKLTYQMILQKKIFQKIIGSIKHVKFKHFRYDFK